MGTMCRYDGCVGGCVGGCIGGCVGERDGCIGRYGGGCIGAMGRCDGRIERCNGCAVGTMMVSAWVRSSRCNGRTEMWDGSGW